MTATWKPLGKNSTVPVRYMNKVIPMEAEDDCVEGPILAFIFLFFFVSFIPLLYQFCN